MKLKKDKYPHLQERANLTFPPMPNVDDFCINQNDWQQMTSAIQLQMPLLVLGPSGCGTAT